MAANATNPPNPSSPRTTSSPRRSAPRGGSQLLEDASSVAGFADRFLETGQPLDLLVNNAGIMAAPLTRVARNVESQFATNHVGHFELTVRLWPALRRAQAPRIVSLSSAGHRFASVDFPWLSLRQDDPSQEGAPPYPPMTDDEILQFAREKLRPLMHPDSVLALWTTNFHLIRRVAPILDAANFSERTILTWVKTRFGTGHILFGQSEQCVIAFRGHPTITLTNESTALFAQEPVLFAPARGHSVKPVEFYNFVERWCPAPRYLDVFSRYKHNDNWDTYGDEAPDQMAPLSEAAE